MHVVVVDFGLAFQACSHEFARTSVATLAKHLLMIAVAKTLVVVAVACGASLVVLLVASKGCSATVAVTHTTIAAAKGVVSLQWHVSVACLIVAATMAAQIQAVAVVAWMLK